MITFEEYLADLNKRGKFKAYPLSSIIEEQYKEAIAHTRGVNMKALLKDYRITEDAEQEERRGKLLKKITKHHFDKATRDIVETTNPNLVSISASQQTTQFLADSRFWAFLREDLIPNNIDDPNAYLVSLVQYVSETQKPTLTPFIVNSQNYKEGKKDDKYLVFSRMIDGVEYFYFISTLEQARFFKNKEGSQAQFVQDEAFYISYNEEMTFPPFEQLGGDLTRDENGNKYYQSFYEAAFAHATMAIRCISDRELTRMAANLITALRQQPCDDCNGTGETIIEHEKCECTSCKGTGNGAITLNIGTILNIQDEDITADGINLDNYIKYIDPPKEGIAVHNEMYKEHIEETEKALNMLFVDQAQSGIAKDIDKEHHTAMINAFAKNLYLNSVLTYIKTIEWFIGSKGDVNIDLPQDFRNSTGKAILERITELKKTGATAGVLYPEYRKLYENMYYNNKVSKRIALFMLKYDPLHIYTNISEKQLASTDLRQFQFSIQLPSALDRLAYASTEVFIKMTDDTILSEVTKLMKLPTEAQLLRDENGELVNG